MWDRNCKPEGGLGIRDLGIVTTHEFCLEVFIRETLYGLNYLGGDLKSEHASKVSPSSKILISGNLLIPSSRLSSQAQDRT